MINLDETIIRICNKEYNYFLDKPNVNGVALGYKTIKGFNTKEKCIVVLVEKKIPKEYLSYNHIIPNFYKGIITDVVENGEIYVTSLTDRIRPVEGGYSIGPAGIVDSGSYGGLVQDSKGIYLLSNNHILALGNLVPIGNPILQPSAEDGGTSPNDVVATLDRFIPIKFKTLTGYPENTVDCALAKVSDSSLVSPHIHDIGIPTGITQPTLNLDVQMSCRTSQYIFGSITMIGATTIANVAFGRRALFINQILINKQALPGDSGALALTLSDEVVGLLFSTGSYFCLCNPIESVLTALNVNLVTI